MLPAAATETHRIPILAADDLFLTVVGDVAEPALFVAHFASTWERLPREERVRCLKWWRRTGDESAPRIVLSEHPIERRPSGYDGRAWAVATADSDTGALAFCAPLMNVLADTPEAVRGVIAHELCHVIAHVHGARFVSEEEEAVDLLTGVLGFWTHEKIDPLIVGAVAFWKSGQPIFRDPLLWPDGFRMPPPPRSKRKRKRAQAPAETHPAVPTPTTKKRKRTTAKKEK